MPPTVAAPRSRRREGIQGVLPLTASCLVADRRRCVHFELAAKGVFLRGRGGIAAGSGQTLVPRPGTGCNEGPPRGDFSLLLSLAHAGANQIAR